MNVQQEENGLVTYYVARMPHLRNRNITICIVYELVYEEPTSYWNGIFQGGRICLIATWSMLKR